MIAHLKGKQNVIKCALLLTGLAGLYLIVAWASYSPLDNGWSVASSATQEVLNKSGSLGAWLIDLLQSMFGKVAFIFPFALTFTAGYLLIMGDAEQLTWQAMSLWFVSLLLLMCGLAGLANVLLANSAYYLSGGFVGGVLADLVGDWLGQFGILLIAMVLTSVGFYFCSGQLLWGLFNRFYHWLTEVKDQTKTEPVPPEATLQKNDDHTPLVIPNVDTDIAPPTAETGLTDVSNFITRPKIIGLKTAEKPAEPTAVMHCEMPQNLTDVSRFQVENPQPLPKVSVSDAEPLPVHTSPISVETEDTVETLSEPTMPQVRLNPSSVAVSPTVNEEGQNEFSRASMETALDESLSLPSVSMPHEKAEPQPSFLQTLGQNAPPEPMETLAETEAKPKASYPKGYGNSLIHPLLERQKTVEKPTTPLPTLDLLNPSPAAPQQITEQEIRETSARIEQELANFGIKATVEDVLVGPVVTRYEIQPAAGVKAAKIAALGSDLARSLIFKAIRITEAVPGKPYIGIEAPNRQRETVWLRDVLESEAFRCSEAILPMALGKDISGNPIVVDMAKMPHLLVAGQTGGGKSVGVNTMILSLLFKLTPDQVRFIMIDPKVVELSVYNDIPHLLTPVVTDMKKAENALRWAVEEMERRYLLLSSVNVRNIEGYNSLIKKANEEMGIPIPNPLWRPGDTMDQMPPPLEKMSYIVLVVDEFADLMMSAGKQVEDYIMRIAQKARAVGIHLILATQRPSTDVITGVIKANIPSRIAFTVASQIDSRTILDKGGAESLLGWGDMLYAPNGSPELVRVHGAFMTDDEVNRIADNWRARGKPAYIENITASNDNDNGNGDERDSGDLDPLFDEIVQFVIDTEITSISGIQRRFKLGFNRAGRIVDQLEAEGILSAQDSRGKREILAR